MNKAYQSTRLSIVEQSIADILDRLDQLAPSRVAEDLRAKVRLYERAIQSWPSSPPSSAERAKMLSAVIELHVEVMHLGITK
jgi:hypothetical protein